MAKDRDRRAYLNAEHSFDSSDCFRGSNFCRVGNAGTYIALTPEASAQYRPPASYACRQVEWLEAQVNSRKVFPHDRLRGCLPVLSSPPGGAQAVVAGLRTTIH